MKKAKLKELTDKELTKLKQVEIEILLEFIRICNKYDLKYTLCGGSLIGAVRHNGFIPWDDDIDIHMLRKDYNKFIEVQEKELDKKRFYFQSLEISDEFGWPFGKLRRKDSIYMEWNQNMSGEKQGIWIDIFPIDKIPKNIILSRLTYFKVFYLKILLFSKLGNYTYSKNKLKNVILKIIIFNSRFYSKDKLMKKLYNTMTKYNNLEKNYNLINYGGSYLLNEIYDPKIIKELILHKFEGHDVYITKYYDEYLTQIYGDYMKLPPKEKQVSHHEIIKIKFPKKGK